MRLEMKLRIKMRNAPSPCERRTLFTNKFDLKKTNYDLFLNVFGFKRS